MISEISETLIGISECLENFCLDFVLTHFNKFHRYHTLVEVWDGMAKRSPTYHKMNVDHLYEQARYYVLRWSASYTAERLISN